MADEMDSDTHLGFKRRITEIEYKQEATVEQDSLSLSTENELSEIVSPSKEDQETSEITSAFVSDCLNSFSKKVRCSSQSNRVEKKEVYGNVKDEVAGIAEYDLGFSGAEGKEDMQERESGELGTVCEVQERHNTVNGQIVGFSEKKEMVGESGKVIAKDKEVCEDYIAIEEKESVFEVQMGSFLEDYRRDFSSYATSDVDENQGSFGKVVVSNTVWKNKEKQFLVESEVGSITEIETHLVKGTDFGSSEETLGESTKIEEGFAVDEKKRGNHTSEIKEVNKIVENDGVKVDGLKGIGGSIRCSLKIEVIDETALIESVDASKTGNGCGKEMGFVGLAENTGKNYKKNGNHEMVGKKEKRPRRRGKGLKKDLEMNEKRTVLTHIGEARNGFGENGGKVKRVYSRKEMEALRFVNIEKQRKMWYEVYCGLGPAVAREYDDLVNCANQKHVRLNFDPRQQYGKKGEAPSILGAVCSQDVDNEIECKKEKELENVNPLDPACVHSFSGEDGYTVLEEKCSEDGGSDDDYDSIQRPAFLVEGEPDFDSGPPEDGLEYLRRVRWEAAQIPKVKVAKLDRSKLNKEQTVYMPKIPDIVKCSEHLLPLKEWENAFLASFSELRLALSCLEGFSALDSCKQPSMPILHENSGNYPSLSAILGMDSVARVLMLRRRISSLETMSTLPRSDCVWLYALCAAIDTPLDADTSAALRCLLRKCASLRAGKSELDDEVVMLNILATISGRYFGQSEN